MVWNMIYDVQALEGGTLPSATPEQLWSRLERFLEEVVPVAEEAGVKLAAHPDDPPMPFVRGQPRLVYQPSYYQKLLDLNPSRSNTLEFCIGSLAEMTEGDIYDTGRHLQPPAAAGLRAFPERPAARCPPTRRLHRRRGRGHAEGPRDPPAQQVRGRPDPRPHPAMSCGAPWHAGMAFAMGYMLAAMKSLGIS